MERDDRPPVATFFASALERGSARIELPESAAHHARVKRLTVGDVVRLTNGRGVLGRGTIHSLGKSSIAIEIEGTEFVAPPTPIHLRAPVADRERMLWLGEKATELGVATWQGVRFRRSSSVSPRGEGFGFAAKLMARMENALEQSGSAWLPKVLPETTVGELISRDVEKLRLVLDASGEPIGNVVDTTAAKVVLLVGPEGGIEAEELELLASSGWRSARLADTTLRFETAAVAAIAFVRALTLLRT